MLEEVNNKVAPVYLHMRAISHTREVSQNYSQEVEGDKEGVQLA